MQLFCQEEFLRRLEKSKYAENLVLKGGLFLYSLTDFDSRVTADVDFLLRKLPNTPEQLQKILEEIIVTETGNDFVGYLLNDCNMSEIFGICSTSMYSDYDSSIVTSRRFSPRVSMPSIFLGNTPDYSDDFERELADVFCYSCFDEGEKYIVKLKYDYIKHNTIIAFPSVIFVKELFDGIPYTITSKNSPEVVSGEIKVTDDVQNQ